tara:strand:- start:2895 stop:4373 length:1479 start_codon:yes stop_codon:yes gene_type:complete
MPTKKYNFQNKPFVNGEFINPHSKLRIDKISPINGDELSKIPNCGKNDIDYAVQSARQSFLNRKWVDTNINKKKQILFNLANLIEENLNELAYLDTIETGRSIKNYFFDSIPKAIHAIRWFTESVDKYYGKSTLMMKNNFSIITNQPIGVVGIITPWNDPLVVASWKFTPALLMGNSIIVKPSENSTYSILKIAELTKKVGLPKGVFNVVPGLGNKTGKILAKHKDVDAIYFTGSSETGKKILCYSGESNMKKVNLECGGKSPFIVSKNCANLANAAKSLTKHMFYNQGQICSAPSRLLIYKDIKKLFIEMLINNIDRYIPSDPFDMDSEVGCLISKRHKDKISSFIKEGLDSGANIIKYHYSKENLPLNGQYIIPTIFDNVDSNSNFSKSEIFGPVLSIIEFEGSDKAIEIANNTSYGLASSIWSNKIDEIYKYSRLLHSGLVHVNSYGEDDNTIPFGGVKQSGIGKDKSFIAFQEYSITKSICMQFGEFN